MARRNLCCFAALLGVILVDQAPLFFRAQPRTLFYCDANITAFD